MIALWLTLALAQPNHLETSDPAHTELAPADQPAPSTAAPEEDEPPSSAPIDAPAPEPPATAPPLLTSVLPHTPMRGVMSGLLLLILSISASLGAQVARSTRSWLRPTGLLVRANRAAEVGGRALSAFFAVGVLAAWAPAPLAHVAPWAGLFAAVALGWSARDLLQDATAALTIFMESSLRRGDWVRVGNLSGRLQSVGPRSSLLVSPDGQHLVPNRLLMGAVNIGAGGRSQVSVQLNMTGVEPARARRLLAAAAMSCPYVACQAPRVMADPLHPHLWTVSVTLLDGSYEADFKGSMAERVPTTAAAQPDESAQST